jgi:uncharacterized protein
MRKLFCFMILCAVFGTRAAAQELDLPRDAVKDEAALARAMPELAKRAIAIYQEPDRGRYLSGLFRMQIVAGQYAEAVATLRSLTDLWRTTNPASALSALPFEILTKASAL